MMNDKNQNTSAPEVRRILPVMLKVENLHIHLDERSTCVASRPSIEGDTNEDSKEVKTDTLTLQATPLANGYVKAKTGTNTSDDVYNKWYEKVYEPQAEASSVVTEETDPQG